MHVDVDFSKFQSAIVTALSGIINCNVQIICFLIIFITLKCHFHSFIFGVLIIQVLVVWIQFCILRTLCFTCILHREGHYSFRRVIFCS